MIVDTKVSLIDPQRGIIGGYATPFGRRDVYRWHLYQDQETAIEFLPPAGVDYVPLIFGHKKTGPDLLPAGMLLDWRIDEQGVYVRCQLAMFGGDKTGSERALAMIAQGRAYFCPGKRRDPRVHVDGYTSEVSYQELSIVDFPGITPAIYESDEDYLMSIIDHYGGLPPEVDVAILEGQEHPPLRKLGDPLLADLQPGKVPDLGLELSQVNPVQLLPPQGRALWANGQELVVWSTTRAFYLKSFIALKKPVSVEITPPDLGSFQIKQMVVDPFSNFTTSVGCYLLASDGTNSKVAFCPNVVSPGAAGQWTWGATLTGVFNIIRATGTAGSVMVYSTTSTSGSTLYSTTTQAYTDLPGNNTGIAITAGDSVSITTTGSWDGFFGAGNFYGPDGVPGFYYGTTVLPSAQGGAIVGQIGTGGWFLVGASVTFTAASTGILYLICNDTPGTFYNNTGSMVSSVTITTLSGQAQTRFSSDYGVTFAASNYAGLTPVSGSGSMDIQRVGSNSFAGANQVVSRATTFGGIYSTYYSITGSAQAAAIVVPYFTWSGALNTANANPDIIVGLNAADGSGRTLLWLEGGATVGTLHDLTPVASFLFSNPNSITCSYQHHIIVTGSVSAVAKCYRTTNRGSAWSLVSITGPVTFVRTRRNDNRASAGSGTDKGQCYIMDNGSPGYTSTWASLGFYPRTPPVSLSGFDTIY